MPADLAPSTAVNPPTETAWGGLAGAPLPPEAQRPGVRAVNERGEHGVITSVPGYSIRWRGVALDAGATPIRLDNGLSASAPTPRLYAELRGPDRARIPPTLPGFWRREDPPLRPDRPMSAPELFYALREEERNLPYGDVSRQPQRTRAAVAEALNNLTQWLANNPTHPDRARVEDAELFALRYALLGARSAFELRDRDLLARLRVDWKRDYRVGDLVAVLDEGLGDHDPGWILEAIDGARAQLRRGVERREAMLWRLRVERPAARSALDPKQPASLNALLEENLGLPYVERWNANGFGARVARALRDLLPALLRSWLGEAGLDLTVTRQGEVYSLRSRRRPFTDEERAIVQAHLPTARWTEDDAWVRYEADFTHILDGRNRDLEIGAAYAERLAMMLSEALRAEGFRVSRVGEERRVEAARACEPVVFELKGHGRIRVDCGDPADPAAWHSLYVKEVRFAWGGGRWLKGKLPPLAVLEAVRQRGIRVFG